MPEKGVQIGGTGGGKRVEKSAIHGGGSPCAVFHVSTPYAHAGVAAGAPIAFTSVLGHRSSPATTSIGF